MSWYLVRLKYPPQFTLSQGGRGNLRSIMNDKIHKNKGIYLIPNLLTLGTLFAGFYAIVAANNGLFHYAGYGIVIAMLMDNLDGRIARALNTSSDFGAELDSLSDMVAFGVAPALITYHWALNNAGKLGWLIAFFYTAATALRLARFNTQIQAQDKKFFQGLSCPAAAGIVVGLVWFFADFEITSKGLEYLVALVVLSVAALMVSNIRYHSFKQFGLKDRVPFVALLLCLFLLIIIFSNPPQVLFLLFLSYGLSGPALTLWHLHRKRRQRKRRNINS